MTQRVRLIAGLVLFVYVTTHLLNHSLGLISLDAMEAGRGVFLAAWRNPVGQLLLYVSLIVHFALAHWALYRRRGMRMPPAEIARIALGLSIVPLLAVHVIGTRLAGVMADTNDTYTYVLLIHWRADPEQKYIQTAALLFAWTHGVIGLHYWLRFKTWYRASLPWAYAAAIVVPLCAWLGYAQGGREVLRLAEDPDWLRQTVSGFNLPSAEAAARLKMAVHSIYILCAGALVLVVRSPPRDARPGSGAAASCASSTPTERPRLFPRGAPSSR